MPIEVNPWKNAEYLHLFLSHAQQGKSIASELKAELAEYCIEAFVAHEDIEPTSHWVEVMEAALKTCEALVALVTPDFSASRWTDQEVGYCLGRGAVVVPVRLGQDPYGFLGKYQALPGVGLSPDQLSATIWKVLATSTLSEKLAQAFVMAFEQSHSFITSLKLAKGLADVGEFTSDQRQRLEQCLDTNNNVAGAFGVPEKLREILGHPSGGLSAILTKGAPPPAPPSQLP